MPSFFPTVSETASASETTAGSDPAPFSLRLPLPEDRNPF